MSRTARKITFPNAGIINGSRVWRNRETGVEIIKGKNFAEVGLYYVCHPTEDGRAVGFTATTLKAARGLGEILAKHMRKEIAGAYTAACLEDSDREGERLVREREALETVQIEKVEEWHAEAPAESERVKVGDRFRDPNLLGSPCVVTEVSENGQRFSARWMPGGSVTWYPASMARRWQRA